MPWLMMLAELLKGSRIDLAFNSRAEALRFGRQNCKSIYFITIYKLLKALVYD